MSLSSVACPAWVTIRGARFATLDGPTLVTILITHAALDYIARKAPAAEGQLASFNTRRDAIEHIANIKHQRGQIDESGAVIVKSGDMEGSRF